MTIAHPSRYRTTEKAADDGHFLRRARKAHICRQCGAAIVVGERHVEYLGGSPAYQSGPRYCLNCMVKDGTIEVQP